MSKYNITLKQLLSLVGTLNDREGEDTARERLHRFLEENVKEVGQVRDFIEECLRNTGDQYNKALQDLINHLGTILGFVVEYGRYQGAQGRVGNDGLWVSPTGYVIVIEVKTTAVYAIDSSTLIGYIESLISAGKIKSRENAMGLYVVGREQKISQLENEIIATKRSDRVRIISVESLLSLADIYSEYDVSHEDVVEILRPSGPSIDPIINLIEKVVGPPVDVQAPSAMEPIVLEPIIEREIEVAQGEADYWITSVKSDEEGTAREVIERLVGEERVYAFGDKTPGRKALKAGDWICFYESTNGVVAHAMVASKPERNPHKAIRRKEVFPWTFKLKNAKLYLDDPVVIDAQLRLQLDAFKDRDPNKPWAWFVQSTHRVSERDFKTLTRTSTE